MRGHHFAPGLEVAGRRALDRPAIARSEQFIHQAALGLAESQTKHVAPFTIHDDQQRGDIAERLPLAGAEPGVGLVIAMNYPASGMMSGIGSRPRLR